MKIGTTAPLRLLAGLLALAGPALAFAQAPDKGDTAWMLTSTALVLLMSVPALALFYGGLVRSKNMLSVLMQVFVSFSLITVLWCIYGYSFAFTTGNAFFGGTARLFLDGLFDPEAGTFALGATFSKATPMYEIVFVAIPSDVRRDHVLPDPGLARRAHQVLGGAAVPRHLVHVRVHPRRPHGLVLGGSGRVHRRSGC